MPAGSVVTMLALDGSLGEGGGQILRTALAASVVTGSPFRVDNIRAGRRSPGLRAQHLAAVAAARSVGSAQVAGAHLGSQQLVFHPGPIRAGRHSFDVGTAGSTTLVAQTVLPVLLKATSPSQIEVTGGTHNEHAPPFEFFAATYVPAVVATGAELGTVLHRHGFQPAGGGKLSVSIRPSPDPRPIELIDRGDVLRCSAVALISQLPRHVADRELAVVARDLGWSELEAREVDAAGPGNALLLSVESRNITTVVSSIGRRGLRAERVAEKAVAATRAYLDGGVPVGPHLADQLLLPMAIAAGGVFRTGALTPHFNTNAHVVQRFLPVRIEVRQDAPAGFVVGVEPVERPSRP